ncbi:MAG TPA: DUF362 domain-containing protein [Spirochaetota bacterium]|nr:DUF362 domain-containing protein [Spirochaetota bacterium]HPF08063.1 DUF362 domain-containing protein [Spirochaetota bacterium]HRX49657.1 DUF362 domain-containing protein [Spirochaetota bacterium]
MKNNEKKKSITRPRVILRQCTDYSVEHITGIIHESVKDLGHQIKGKVFIKPNVVSANREYIHNSYTHPAVVESMVGVLRERNISDIIIGESGGYGIPSRLFLKEAGYFEMAKRIKVPVLDMNEYPSTRIQLTKGTCHKEMMLSDLIREADYKIWMPKLKYHIFASITNALKLNIGILQHSERMLYHDYRIHEKIVDMLEAGYPDLIVSDAIDITYGFESAPYPVRLGVLLISDNPLAADAVASYIMGYNPEDVQHLKIASERGYGSLKLKDISIEGNADIEKLRKKPKGNRRLFQHLDELDTPIKFYAGCVPGTDTICDGGCEAAVKGLLGTIEKKGPGSLKKAKPGAIVHGVYKGNINMPGQPVMLLGDCTRVEGKLIAGKVYRVKGCPIGVKKLMAKLPGVFNLPNPMFDPRDAYLFIINSAEKAASSFKHKILKIK